MKKILIGISICASVLLASCSNDKDNLIPAPTVSSDSTYSYVDPLGNSVSLQHAKGDVVIALDSVTNLALNLNLKAGTDLRQVDIQFFGVATKKSDNTPAFTLTNSKGGSYTQLLNDFEGWWGNASFNGGWDSQNSSVMKIVLPKAKGEIILNAIVHDRTGKQGYLTRKITIKK